MKDLLSGRMVVRREKLWDGAFMGVMLVFVAVLAPINWYRDYLSCMTDHASIVRDSGHFFLTVAFCTAGPTIVFISRLLLQGKSIS